MDKIKCGVIGAGFISREIHLPILKNIDWLSLRYAADINKKNLKLYEKEANCKTVLIRDSIKKKLPRADVVLMAIPVGARMPYVKVLKERGTHIFCEKPFATDIHMHNEVISSSNLSYCNYMRVNLDQTRKLKQIVNNNIFGRLDNVVWREGGIQKSTGKGKESYQNNIELSGGGILIQNGCHAISQIVEIFKNKDIFLDDSELEYVKEFDVDVKAKLKLESRNSNKKIDFEITAVRKIEQIARFEFERAIVKFKPGKPDTKVTVHPSEATSSTRLSLEASDIFATSLIQAHYLRWEEFLGDLRKKASTVSTDITTGRRVTTLIQDIYNN